MAIVRCERHSPPREVKRHYVARVNPIGYPDTGVICGRTHCDQPGFIWLEQSEKTAYGAGQRVFDTQTGRVKVRAQ